MVFLDLSEYFLSPLRISPEELEDYGMRDRAPRSVRSSLIFMNYVCDMHYWFSHLL